MTDDVIESKDKNRIRNEMKKQRSTLSVNRIMMHSAIIAKRLFDLDEYKEAEVVLPYVSFSSEVDTHVLINEALKSGKKIAVPRVVSKDQMKFYFIKSFSDLKPGSFGILEPVSTDEFKPDPSVNAVVLLPGLAFDNKLNRIGYGGGFYDKYLSCYPYIYKIMLAYELEKNDSLPSGELDIKPDMVITELNIYR